MHITQEKVTEQNALLTIAITKEDYSQKLDRALKGYQKQVTMPGFRTGKVPMDVVKKRYGRSVLAEELNKVLNNSIQQFITDEKLQILGSPIPSRDHREKGDWDNPSDFEFVYELGLAPHLDVKVGANDQFDFHRIAIDQSMVNEQVERMRRRYGKLRKVEEVEGKDMLMGDFVELNEGDVVNPAGIFHSGNLTLEFLDAEIVTRFVGKKIGDSVIVDPHKLAGNHDDLAKLLGVDHEQVHHLQTNIKFIIRDINRLEMAELNQEFLERLLGEGATEEALREKISADLEGHFQRDSEQLFRRDISTKMVAKYQPSLPDGFLKRWILMTNEKPMTEDDVERDYHTYRQGLQWQLVFNNLVSQKLLEIEPEALMNKAKAMMAEQYKQYGMPLPEDEELTQTALRVLKDKEESRRLVDEIYNDKLVAFIREKATVNEKSVSYDEFVKLAAQA